MSTISPNVRRLSQGKQTEIGKSWDAAEKS